MATLRAWDFLARALIARAWKRTLVAGAAQPVPANVPLTRGEAAADDSVLGMPKLAVSALVLAVLAGVAAFLVRARGKQ
jgi:hypothetical protein